MSNIHESAGEADNSIAKNNPPSLRPEWIRLPREGSNCVFTGLSRSYIAGLIREGKVHSRSLRNRGASRGIRLISYDSIMDYIKGSSEER
ncbi:MAG: hypothetical protein RI910_1535 [Verrucomicrobiota bacterium]|jgi:hypothetical protein